MNSRISLSTVPTALCRPMRAIFVSYRRNDSEGEAGRLFDDLAAHFGEDSVFMDVAAIEVGRDFRKAIDDSVATCGVLLAVIGKEWIDAKNDTGQRRLDDPFDFVRLETASALKRDIPVVPVLVHGAKMPRADQLPDDLKELAYRNGVEVTHARWNSDVQLLFKALRPFVEESKSAPDSPTARGGAQVKQEPAPVLTTVPQVAAETSPATRKRPAGIILAVVAVVMVVGSGAGYMMHKPKQVSVPELSGSTLSEAATKLRPLNLFVGQKTCREDSGGKSRRGKAASEKAAADQAAAERAAADKAAADKAATDRAAADKATAKHSAMGAFLGGLAGGAIAGATGTSGARTGVSEQSSNQQNPWLGNWVSADPRMRDITRLTISQRGQQIVVRAWGACRMTDCDLGYAVATDTGRSLAIQWNQGFATRDVRIYSQRDGLTVSVRSV